MNLNSEKCIRIQGNYSNVPPHKNTDLREKFKKPYKNI